MIRARTKTTKATKARATKARATKARATKARATKARATKARATKARASSPHGDGDTIVFVGPTLRSDEVAEYLPGAIIAPPVALGDVLRLATATGRARPARIAIIDGYFERMAAVWHKELLLALERGIQVWGAASMGALRAAELAPHGMRGVGAIYEAYARGELTADDEVAVAHLPAEHGYRAISDAMVNLRAGIAAAPMLSDRTRAALIELARARFYRERTWAGLLADGHDAGLPANELAALAAWPKPDRKADDARTLLRVLATPKPSTGLAPSTASGPSTAESTAGSTRRKPSSRGAPRGRGPTGRDVRAVPAKLRVPRTWAFERLLEIMTGR